MEMFYCFTAAIALPGHASCINHRSDYNEDKKSAVAGRMQDKVVVE